MSLKYDPPSEPLHISARQLFYPPPMASGVTFSNLFRRAPISSISGAYLGMLQGCLAHKKLPPPQDHRRALGMVLL